MNRKLVGIVIGIGSGLIFLLKKPSPSRKAARSPGLHLTPLPQAAENRLDVVLRRYLMYFMLPLWFVPGVLDYIWHKRTKIETTSGTEESLIHALMMTEVGLPIVAGLLLEINAGVIALMLAAFVIHSLTAIWDVSFAVQRRLVLPKEQHTHSFLEMLPFCAVSFAICLHWDQFLALFGCGTEAPRFALRAKQPPVPVGYIGAIGGCIGVFIVLPYAEELFRCWKAQKQGLIGTETPECSPQLFG